MTTSTVVQNPILARPLPPLPLTREQALKVILSEIKKYRIHPYTIQRMSGVSSYTIRSWRKATFIGRPIYPHLSTLQAVARSLELTLDIL